MGSEGWLDTRIDLTCGWREGDDKDDGATLVGLSACMGTLIAFMGLRNALIGLLMREPA